MASCTFAPVTSGTGRVDAAGGGAGVVGVSGAVVSIAVEPEPVAAPAGGVASADSSPFATYHPAATASTMAARIASARAAIRSS